MGCLHKPTRPFTCRPFPLPEFDAQSASAALQSSPRGQLAALGWGARANRNFPERADIILQRGRALSKLRDLRCALAQRYRSGTVYWSCNGRALHAPLCSRPNSIGAHRRGRGERSRPAIVRRILKRPFYRRSHPRCWTLQITFRSVQCCAPPDGPLALRPVKLLSAAHI
jgi:hypothetical protein